MNDNYDAWYASHFSDDGPFFTMFTDIVLQAWDACVKAAPPNFKLDSSPPPRLVTSVKQTIAERARLAKQKEEPNIMDMTLDDFQMPVTPASFGNVDTTTTTGSVPAMGAYDMSTPEMYDLMGGAEMYGDMQPAPGMASVSGMMGWNEFGRQPGWGS